MPAPVQSSGAPLLRIVESDVPDGPVHLALSGELDLECASVLAERLNAHRASGRRVQLDLAELDFMDTTGLQTVLVGVTEGRAAGAPVEVGRELRPSVARLFDVTQAGPHLWPPSDST